IALESMAPLNDKIHLFASGGVRTGIDMAKAIILNAELCGLASPFLKAAMDSPDAVIKVIESLKREFQTAMFLLGMSSVEKLKGNKSLILKQ
ncbi:MAG: alpha-hydroxy-acid oxidizing protein, partial [Lentisphaeria bacterium]|nr:alpha-hydroxy-acid oxidizing protein [Lentisphaeria bacterium]